MSWSCSLRSGAAPSVLVSLVIGVRVMWLAQRTRGLPEFAMALGLMLMGGLGYPILILAQFGSFLPDDARVFLIVVHLVFHAIAMPAVAVFNWRVFRPREAWATAFVIAIVSAVLACFVGQSVDPGYRAMALGGERVWLALRTDRGGGLPLVGDRVSPVLRTGFASVRRSASPTPSSRTASASGVWGRSAPAPSRRSSRSCRRWASTRTARPRERP